MLYVDNFSELFVEMGFPNSANDAIDQLIFINQRMLNSTTGHPLNSIFLGGGNLVNMKTPAQPASGHGANNAENFMIEIFSTVSASDATLAIKGGVSLDSIVLLKGQVDYGTFTPGTTMTDDTAGARSDTIGLDPALRDVNLWAWCTTASSKFLSILQKLYYIHDLFNMYNWNNFRSNNTVRLHGFIINNANASVGYVPAVRLITIDSYALQANEYDVLNGSPGGVHTVPVIFLKNLIDVSGDGSNTIDFNYLKTMTNINTLIYRRLFYLWIRMAQFKIASIAVANASAVSGSSTAGSAANIILTNVSKVQTCQFRLLYLANQYLATNSSFNKALFGAIADRQANFRVTAANVKALNTQINAGKNVMTNNQNTITTKTKTNKVITIFQYTMLAILGAVIAAAAAVASGIGTSVTTRSSYSVLILMGVVVSVLIVMLVYQHYVPKETFTSTYGNTLSVTASNSDGFIENVLQYVQNTVTAIAYLDSYDMIDNVNKSVQQDMVRYQIANNDINVSGQRLDTIAKYVELTSIVMNARVYLLIFITMVIGITVPMYVWSENSPTMRYIILAIAALVTLIAIVMYGYQVTSIVRIDGEKKYWGQPSAYTVP